MDKRNEHLENLSEIRSLMERSSRFISLSGLSGIAAGIFALIGAAMVYLYLDIRPFEANRLYYAIDPGMEKWGMGWRTFFILDAAIVFLLALAGGILFTTRKAKKKGQKIWDALSRRLVINTFIPLVAGGFYCLGLLYHGQFGLVAPSTLIFYGLACINGSKYTLTDIRYLGICEIILGIVALFNIGYGLEFWIVGFGFLHIIYGLVMYYKYERVSE